MHFLSYLILSYRKKGEETNPEIIRQIQLKMCEIRELEISQGVIKPEKKKSTLFTPWSTLL